MVGSQNSFRSCGMIGPEKNKIARSTGLWSSASCTGVVGRKASRHVAGRMSSIGRAQGEWSYQCLSESMATGSSSGRLHLGHPCAPHSKP